MHASASPAAANNAAGSPGPAGGAVHALAGGQPAACLHPRRCQLAGGRSQPATICMQVPAMGQPAAAPCIHAVASHGHACMAVPAGLGHQQHACMCQPWGNQLPKCMHAWRCQLALPIGELAVLALGSSTVHASCMHSASHGPASSGHRCMHEPALQLPTMKLPAVGQPVVSCMHQPWATRRCNARTSRGPPSCTHASTALLAQASQQQHAYRYQPWASLQRCASMRLPAAVGMHARRCGSGSAVHGRC